MRNFLFLLFILAAGLLACTEENQSAKQTSPEPIAPNAISEEQQALLDCLSEPSQICQIGLWFAMLEDPISDLPLEDILPKEIADSVISEGEYAVVRRTVYLEEGEVVVEGEYIEEAQATEENLNASKVNRIYIRSSEYHTQDSVRIGDSVQKLIDLYGAEGFEVGAIPAYQTISVSRVDDPHLFYHFTDKGNEIGTSAGEQLSIADLPKDWRMREIVVF